MYVELLTRLVVVYNLGAYGYWLGRMLNGKSYTVWQTTRNENQRSAIVKAHFLLCPHEQLFI